MLVFGLLAGPLGVFSSLPHLARNIFDDGLQLFHGAGLLHRALAQGLSADGNLLGAAGNLVGAVYNLG